MVSSLLIVFEDEQILVLEKPAGLVVNKSETIKEETLQDQISSYLQLKDLGIGDRAGIVHRLDRETSGLLVVAKTKEAFENLQAQFKNRQISKVYCALVHGETSPQGEINEQIGRIGKFGKFGIVPGGRDSLTRYKRVAKYTIGDDLLERLTEGETKQRVNYIRKHATVFSLIDLLPKTGRTHQIRVHLKSINHPVVSDLIYAPSKLIKFDLKWCPRLFLHAKLLSFVHPKTKKKISFSSELPRDISESLRQLTVNS